MASDGSSGHRRSAALIGVAIVALSASFVARAAQVRLQGRAAPMQALTECRKLTDPQLRLACYDRAAGALDAAETQGDVVVIDRAQARQVRRQAFGLNLPSITLFQRGEKEENFNRISVALTGAHQSGDGKWVFVTSEDQVWRQTDDANIFNEPHAGSTLAIRRAALGSFFCNVDGQLGVKCMRDH